MKLPIPQILSLLSLGLSMCVSAPACSSNVIRAAIDVGSGGPKLRVAEVDLTTHKIVKVLHIGEYHVVFQDALSRSEDRTLSPEIMLLGLKAIKDAITMAKTFETDGIVIIGTSIFRNAANGEQFASAIHSETGLRIHILDQDLEGKLAFQAALAHSNANSENLVVWDIGGGSTQFIGLSEEDSYLVDKDSVASGPFKDFIIESIQQRNIQEHRTPNPISHVHAIFAEAHAISLSAKVDQIFQNKIRSPATQVVGVGSAFGRGISPLVRKNPFTIDDLTHAVWGIVGKADCDLGNSVFSCVEVTNALLVLGFMKGLGIEQMNTADVNNADGAMVYKTFWE